MCVVASKGAAANTVRTMLDTSVTSHGIFGAVTASSTPTRTSWVNSVPMEHSITRPIDLDRNGSRCRLRNSAMLPPITRIDPRTWGSAAGEGDTNNANIFAVTHQDTHANDLAHTVCLIPRSVGVVFTHVSLLVHCAQGCCGPEAILCTHGPTGAYFARCSRAKPPQAQQRSGSGSNPRRTRLGVSERPCDPGVPIFAEVMMESSWWFCQVQIANHHRLQAAQFRKPQRRCCVPAGTAFWEKMWCASRHVTRVFAIVRSGGAALSAVRTAPQPHARRAIHSHTACRGTGKPTAAKPRAAKSARQTSLARNTKQQVIFGMIGGSALYFGYHLYTTKQTPWEWATKLYGDALDAYQDAADPTEEFIRNSIQVRRVHPCPASSRRSLTDSVPAACQHDAATGVRRYRDC